MSEFNEHTEIYKLLDGITAKSDLLDAVGLRDAKSAAQIPFGRAKEEDRLAGGYENWTNTWIDLMNLMLEQSDTAVSSQRKPKFV